MIVSNRPIEPYGTHHAEGVIALAVRSSYPLGKLTSRTSMDLDSLPFSRKCLYLASATVDLKMLCGAMGGWRKYCGI